MAYACGVCRNSFSTDTDLHSHRVDSDLVNCRTCLFCDYSFLNKRSDQVRSHMVDDHSDVACKMCNRKLFLTESRVHHMRDAHCFVSDLPATGKSFHDQDETVDNLVVSMKHSYISHVEDGAVGPLLNKRNMEPRQKDRSFLSDLRTYGDFMALLQVKVKPDPTKLSQCKEIVQKLMLFMQHNTKYDVAEVVKGGSLGKGTSIRAKVDIDVAVFLNDFDNVRDLRENMRSVLGDLRTHITQDANWAAQVEFTKFTAHSIQFKLKTDPAHELSEIDLLPACDLGNGPRSSIFREMTRLTPPQRSFYSVCLVKDQLDFVKKVPDSVKDLIQLVKHWKRSEDIGIVSYCIELIVISQWKSWDEPLWFDLKSASRNILGFISRFSTAKITWPSEYRQLDYMELPDPPYVMDPANPFINTADRVTDVGVIEAKAREVLRQL